MDEIGANFAVMNALTQAAESEVEVWENGVIALLDDESIEEREASPK